MRASSYLLVSVIALNAAALDSAKALDKIKLGLNWLPQADFGGFYQALADGTYEKYGLDVSIYPGGPQISSAQLLASGSYDFARVATGITMFDLVEQKLPYIAIAALYQFDPQVLISHKDQGIKNIEGMAGHPIMLTQEAVRTWWPFIRLKYGLIDAQIRPYTLGNASFISNKTTITQGYFTSDLLSLKRQGISVDHFLLADFGYNPYSSLIVTSKKTIANHPELVARFLKASIEGWKTYLHGDHSLADERMKRDNPDFSSAAAEEAIKAMNSSGLLEGGEAASHGIGCMTQARWEDFYRVMVEVKNVPADLSWKDAYTTKFLDPACDSR